MVLESSAQPAVAPAVLPFPSRGLDLTGARLPAEQTPLVGREPELLGIHALLSRADLRLLTITGPGGGGKTRLALRVASRAAEEVAEGAAFVSLAAVADPDLVTPTIFQALGGREGGAGFSAERLQQLIGDHELLLVLDNFEHLLPAAPAITDLLVACPHLTIVVTSRVALRLSGEHEFRIPPLSLPDLYEPLTAEQALQSDAIRLFVQRASAARADFPTDEGTLRAVASVCQHLDGLPLAIELAAARVTHLSPAALLERLQRPAASRLPLLTGGARDQPARLRTMRDTIAWSHDLLDATEQALLQQLAVFVGGFSLAAAEAISQPGGRPSPITHHPSPDTLDTLGSLVANSLVVYEGEVGGEPRYAMLETIREFALERLAESGQAAAARNRHAEWVVELAERVGPKTKGPDSAVWVAYLEREHPNVRAALGWLVEQRDAGRLARLAGAIWPFWQEHAHYAEGRRWLETALELCQDVAPAQRRRLLTGAGAMAWYQADVETSRQRHEEALALAQQIGDRGAIAFELGNLGVHASELGDHDLAISRFEASLAVAREIGDPEPIVLAQFNLAFLDWERGDGPAAIRRLEEALVLARQHRMAWILPNIMIGLGTTTLDLGDPERALAHFRESIGYAQARGNLGDVIDGVEGIAKVACMTGQAEVAARLFGATDAIREALGTPFLPSEHTQFGPVLALLRERLGDAGYAAAWASGREMDQASTIAAAQAVTAGSAALTLESFGLTERELEVLRLVAQGHTNRELGDLLYISPATAARHVANIYGKIGIDSRAKATAFAREHRLI